MIKKKIFLVLISLFLAASSCGKKEIIYQKSSKITPKVLVTVAPYIYFVKKIAQDTVEVEAMIPPNANPHLYEPTPHQTSLVTKADIWFKIGEGFEKYLIDFLGKNNSNLIISDLRENIDLLPYEESQCKFHDHIDFKDVHIWTSPKLAKIQAKTICEVLTKKYPANADFYFKNLSSFLGELDILDQEISSKLSSIKGTTFLISHPAFGYFCKDYGLTQLSIEFQGKDPTLKKLKKTLEEVKEKNIKKVFVQAQYNNKGAIFIAEKMGIGIEYVDPYCKDYDTNLKNFVNLLIAE